MAFTLPALTYAYNALEPIIDAKTMEIHHTKHHQTYVDKLNAALANFPDLASKSIVDLLKNWDDVPVEVKTAVRNHGGGHANHTLFWEVMAPGGSKIPTGELKIAIEAAFGNWEDFTKQFVDKAVGQFGSGWGWLVRNGEGKLELTSTSNQDSPWAEGKTPLMGVDVWEHAYYLTYQNRRPDYVTAWLSVVNWDVVNDRYNQSENYSC